MKLLIFIHSLSSGGAERVTTNLANYWAEKGWNITIVTITGSEQDFYQLHSQVHRIALRLDGKSNNLAVAIKHNYQRIKALRGVLKEHRPDVALAFMATANIILAMSAKGLNIPVLGSERIYPPMVPLGKVWEWLRRYSYAYLEAVIALSSESAKWISTETNAKNVPVIANAVTYPIAVNTPLVSPKMSDEQRFNLIAVGRLAPQKGFDHLLCAFASTSQQFPNWHLTILGEGECRAALEKQRLELGLEQRVSLPGVVGNLGAWYEAADLYVMTSLFEGFPNSLSEAMAYGIPVVSVDCDTGPRDIIRHQVDGLLVPQDNHKALVDALATLMDGELLRLQYANRAIEIRERLSMEKITGMWEEVFTSIRK